MLQVTGHKGHYSLASHSDRVLHSLLGQKIHKIQDCEVKGQETPPDPQDKMAVTLHKLSRWLPFTLPWLITCKATWSYHILQSLKSPSKWEEPESPLWSEAQQGSSEASVENSLCSVLFMATQQMCNSRATAPNDLFLLHTKSTV